MRKGLISTATLLTMACLSTAYATDDGEIGTRNRAGSGSKPTLVRAGSGSALTELTRERAGSGSFKRRGSGSALSTHKREGSGSFNRRGSGSSLLGMEDFLASLAGRERSSTE